MLVPIQGMAQDVRLRLAHVFPEQSSVGEAADMFAELAAERSDGRIDVKVYPAGQLGGDEAIGRGLSRGTIQLAFLNPNSLVGIDPLFDFHILPYIATDYEAVDRIFYGERNIIHETLDSTLEKHDMKTLAYFENGFRDISNSQRPVRTVDDLDGLKLRVVPSQSLKLFFDKAGSQVVIMPFPELFTALQQGTVDGQENGVILIEQARFFEAQKYVTLTHHSYVMSTITASQRAFEGLDEKDRELLTDIAEEVSDWQIERNRENAEKALKAIKDAGLEVIEPSAEAQEGFRAVADEVWSELTSVYGQDRVDALRDVMTAD
ncbi:transporter [Salinisphaera orenii YIM 95161]|uniref:Transporter n=2 Tax=Salinisphaera TaxID=180541 RepID=A0A423Q3F0_9GAMM|nr:transporter [Salinisphaera halophila YIM 95161]